MSIHKNIAELYNVQNSNFNGVLCLSYLWRFPLFALCLDVSRIKSFQQIKNMLKHIAGIAKMVWLQIRKLLGPPSGKTSEKLGP